MEPSSAGYPGTEQYRALLCGVVDYYAQDPRLLAVSVFGSLGRGDWHAASDLDLDEDLHRMRGFFMGMFQAARGGARPIYTFDAEATPSTKELLGATLPGGATPESVRTALARALRVFGTAPRRLHRRGRNAHTRSAIRIGASTHTPDHASQIIVNQRTMWSSLIISD